MGIREQARRLHQVSRGQLTGASGFITEEAEWGSRGMLKPTALDVVEPDRPETVEAHDGLRVVDRRRLDVQPAAKVVLADTDPTV